MAFAVLAGAGLTSEAWADDSPPPDKSAYSIFNPVPDDQQRSLSTDRPTKAVSPVTVDAGHFLIETDLANYAFGTYAGTASSVFVTLDPVIKLGITNSTDVEMLFGGFQSIRTVNAATHMTTGLSDGLGDVSFRLKTNVLGNDVGPFALAIAPLVKIPSSVPLMSNGRVEGGLQVPFSLNLPLDFSIVGTPEFDLLAGVQDFMTRPAFRTATALFHAVPGLTNLTASAEFYSFNSTDRYNPSIYTADFGLTYLVNPALQLDGGIDIGLNRAAPALQVFVGLSKRF